MSSNTGKTSPAEYAQRLDALRAVMQEEGVEGFFIPVADEYQGEYPPACARRVAWLSGFTGSAGALVVLREKAAAFVDGRYTLQVRQQVDASRYEFRDLTSENQAEWVAAHVPAGAKVAYDPWLHTQSQVDAMRKTLAKAGITLVGVEYNLVDAVWTHRPAVPQQPVQVYDEAYAGESSASKRARIAAMLGDADAAVISAPDSIAWLLNIRGNDVACTPLALSFAVLHRDATVDWFIDAVKLSDAVRVHIGNAVRLHPMEALPQAMDELGQQQKTVRYDAMRSAFWFYRELTAAGATVEEGEDPCLLPKACKNPTEIAGIRAAHLRDGVALTQFLHWLEREANQRAVTELEAEERLLAFRKAQDLFREESFTTIAGSAGNGAIVHYRATEDTNKVLERDTIFLLDSGGQYLDGTTDVTRTLPIGQPTHEQKRRFTQVLKGHITLGMTAFPKGVTGQQLDALARAPLWAEYQDYAHGTGHGVGAYLGVHEGPQGIHPRATVPLRPGMVISNEPGFYKEGEYGIRIENLVVVQEVEGTAEQGRPYYCFETLTLAPIDHRLILPEMLTTAELAWLNDYHARVYATLAPALDSEVREWLHAMTRPLAIASVTEVA